MSHDGVQGRFEKLKNDFKLKFVNWAPAFRQLKAIHYILLIMQTAVGQKKKKTNSQQTLSSVILGVCLTQRQTDNKEKGKLVTWFVWEQYQ